MSTNVFDYSNVIDSNANQYLNSSTALTKISWPGFLVLTINVPPNYNILPSNVNFYISFSDDSGNIGGYISIQINKTTVLAAFTDGLSSNITLGKPIGLTKSNAVTISDVFDSTAGTMTFWIYYTSKKSVTINTSSNVGDPHATQFTGIIIGYGDDPSLDTARIQIPPPSGGWPILNACTACSYASMTARNSQGNYLSNIYTYTINSYSTTPSSYPIVNPYTPPKQGNSDWGVYVFLGLPFIIGGLALLFIVLKKLSPSKEDVSKESDEQ
jgi:hypothetical protein